MGCQMVRSSMSIRQAISLLCTVSLLNVIAPVTSYAFQSQSPLRPNSSLRALEIDTYSKAGRRTPFVTQSPPIEASNPSVAAARERLIKSIAEINKKRDLGTDLAEIMNTGIALGGTGTSAALPFLLNPVGAAIGVGAVGVGVIVSDLIAEKGIAALNAAAMNAADSALMLHYNTLLKSGAFDPAAFSRLSDSQKLDVLAKHGPLYDENLAQELKQRFGNDATTLVNYYMTKALDRRMRTNNWAVDQRLTNLESANEQARAALSADQQRYYDALKQGYEKLADKMSVADAGLAQQMQNLWGLAGSILMTNKATRDALEKVVDAQGRLNDGLTAIDTRLDGLQKQLDHLGGSVEAQEAIVAQIARDTDFAKAVLISHMSGEELQRWVDQNWFSEPESKKLAETAKVLKAREDFVHGFKSIADFSANMATILAIAGVDPTITNAIGKAAEIGVGGFAAVAAFAKGGGWNILDGVNILMGLFGEDAGKKRHEQVMRAIEGLATGQEAILERQGLLIRGMNALAQGLDELAKGQQAIINNQRVIAENLAIIIEGENRILANQVAIVENQIALSRQLQTFAQHVEQRFQDLEAKLEGLDSDILFNRRLIASILGGGLTQCEAVLKGMAEPNAQFGQGSTPANASPYRFSSFNGSYLLDYNDIQSHYALFSDAFSECFRWLTGVLSNGVRPSELFFAETYVEGKSKDGVRRARGSKETIAAYDATFAFLELLATGRTNYMTNKQEDFAPYFVASLLFPTYSVKDLLLKRGAILKNLDKSNRYDLPQLPELETLLDVDSAVAVAEVVLRLHHYYSLTTNPAAGMKLTPSGSAGDPIGMRGRELVKNTLKLVTIALAQQVLMSGDLMVTDAAQMITSHEAREHFINRLSTDLRKFKEDTSISLQPTSSPVIGIRDDQSVADGYYYTAFMRPHGVALEWQLLVALHDNPLLAANLGSYSVGYHDRELTSYLTQENMSRLFDGGYDWYESWEENLSINERSVMNWIGRESNGAPVTHDRHHKFNSLSTPRWDDGATNLPKWNPPLGWSYRLDDVVCSSNPNDSELQKFFAMIGQHDAQAERHTDPAGGSHLDVVRRAYIPFPTLANAGRIRYYRDVSHLRELRYQLIQVLNDYDLVNAVNGDRDVVDLIKNMI